MNQQPSWSKAGWGEARSVSADIWVARPMLVMTRKGWDKCCTGRVSVVSISKDYEVSIRQPSRLGDQEYGTWMAWGLILSTWLCWEPPRILARHTSWYVWVGHGGVTLGILSGPWSLSSLAFPFSAFCLQWTKQLHSTVPLCHDVSTLGASQPWTETS